MDMIEQAERYSQNFTGGPYGGTYRGDSDSHLGCNRAVHRTRDYVFKVVKAASTWRQNRAEWEFYTSTTDEIRAYLCKPLYISRNSRVIVMERIIPTDESSSTCQDIIQGLQDELQELLIPSAFGALMTDTCSNYFNWGWKGNRIVLMDYGSLANIYYPKDTPDVGEWLNLRNAMGVVSL